MHTDEEFFDKYSAFSSKLAFQYFLIDYQPKYKLIDLIN